MSLKTDYKDAIPSSGAGTLRKYQQITNSDGTVSFQDVTEYSQIGDKGQASVFNGIGTAVNAHTSSASVHITPLACATTGTVHALTGLSATTGIVLCIFKADANYFYGDTFTVNGTAYTIVTSGGEVLRTGALLHGGTVSVELDVTNKMLHIRQDSAGQVGALPHAPSITADPDNTTDGFHYYMGHPEIPANANGDGEFLQMAHDANYAIQVAYGFHGSGMAIRVKESGFWQPWRSITDLIYYTGIDLHTLTRTGRYRVFNPSANYPSGYTSDSDFFVDVHNLDPAGSATYLVQTIYDIRSTNVFTQHCINGVWSSTQRVNDGGSAAKVANALTIANGYGGNAGAYDGSAAKTVTVPYVTFHTAAPTTTLADGELWGVY